VGHKVLKQYVYKVLKPYFGMEKEELQRKVASIVFRSQHRIVIFSILINLENKGLLTISNVHKGLCSFLKKDYDYKNTYKHIKILENEGLIELKESKNTQGRPMVISLKDERASGIFLNALKILEPHLLNIEIPDEEEHSK